MLTLAKQLPELRQAVALAEAGYNLFEVDGGKAFTLLAPSSTALQALAAGLADGDDQQKLQDGFLSIVLYNQLPDGAYDVDELVELQDPDGMQTSLGRATKDTYRVTFDNNTLPVVATGSWPSNNAQLQSSHEACNGWMHVMGSVLLPSQLGSLPRLVDDTPDLPNSVFMGLIDGSGEAPAGAEPPAPLPEDDGSGGGGAPAPSHSNATGIVVSSGDGSPSNASAADVLAGSSSGGGNGVLVVAASVAAGAVVLCAAVVAGVLLRKRQLRRRRQAQNSRLVEDEGEEDFQPAASKASMRPVQLHVDA
ncbi:adhesion lipo [Micractinium conductrix]|uniref:Adhesion lipo n=1 Tax=Micractinium conductrix TaxID=554055 RepID=A0A2P6VN67_9CHLO|nr:adhesion lipo [Micractinium conductrix]|eukprot:PSC75523.1 adhesion lipo [Micractinium conductrix]